MPINLLNSFLHRLILSILSEKERINLIAIHKKNMKAKEADKIKAILLLDKDYPQNEVCERK